MEYMLMQDRSVRCYDDGLPGEQVMRELELHEGVAYFWEYDYDNWGVLTPGDVGHWPYRRNTCERSEVPHEVLMTDLLR